MPRYYFDISDNGENFTNEGGEELASSEAADTRARRILVQLAEDEIPDDGPSRTIGVSIRGEDGRHVYLVTIAFDTGKNLVVDQSSAVR